MYMTVEEPRYQDNVYLITNPTEVTALIKVTDAGNTLETPDGIIVAHYVGKKDQHSGYQTDDST